MKVYQLKHHEVFLNEQLLTGEERFIEQYKKLFYEKLPVHTISKNKIFQSINICKGTITSRPLVTEALLKKQKLPAFQFLACKN